MYEKTLRAIQKAGSGHPGGSVTVLPILEWLYLSEMRPEDICILSKGHAAPALYAIFEKLGIISESELMKLRKPGSLTQGHPSLRHLPEVITSTGSLGQGLAVAVGLAFADRSRRVFCVVGDGDMQEGISTEVARFALLNQELSNLIVIWDKNDNLSDDYSVVYPDIFYEWSAMGWTVSLVKHPALISLVVAPLLLVVETKKVLPHGSVKLSEEDVCKMLPLVQA